MAGFLQDDAYNSLAVLRLCDALETGDPAERQQLIDRARKNAQAVLNRGKRKPAPDPEPEITPAGVGEETD